MILALDVDGTCADTHTPWIARYNADWNDRLSLADITDWDISKFVKPDCGKKIFDYPEDRTIYRDVLPMDGAQEAVRELRGLGHRVIFVTTTSEKVAGAKITWLRQFGLLPKYRFCDPDYIECGNDKSLIRADVLVDDNPQHISDWLGSHAIVFDRPWNRKFNWKFRALCWSHVVEIVSLLGKEKQCITS